MKKETFSQWSDRKEVEAATDFRADQRQKYAQICFHIEKIMELSDVGVEKQLWNERLEANKLELQSYLD